MKVFLDTSALVKFFHAEDGTGEWVFVTSDDVLCRTVVLAGYSALNPCGKN